MLQKIHDKLSGWMAYAILGLLAVVFTFWGIDFGFSNVRYAAKVKVDTRPWWQPAEKIGIEEVRQAWQNQSMQFQQLYRGELPDELRTSLQQRLLHEFVRNEILTQHTQDLGYRVSDADVVKSYESIPAFQVDGKFSKDTALYQMQLQGISPTTFEAEQRKYLRTAQLQQAIAQSAFLTPAELQMHHRLQNEQREAAWLVLPAAKFAEGIKPDEEAIKAYYEQHQDQYMTAETVALRYVELSIEDVAAETELSEEDLRAYYETVKDRYTGEEGQTRPFEEVRGELEGELRMQEAEKHFGELQEQLADEAFENLNDLEAVAQKLGLTVKEVPVFRRDTGGGELGAKPEVIEAAFSEPVLNGENSRPMELAPGHVVVLRVGAHRPAEPRPLDEVREQVVQAITKEQSQKEARELAQRSAALMQAGTEDLKRLAAEFKTEPQGPQFIGRTDEAMPIELRNALFAAPRPSEEVPAVYRAVPLGNGDSAVLKLSDVRVEEKEETPEQRQTREAQLRQRMAQAEFAAYVGQLVSDSYVAINPKAFE